MKDVPEILFFVFLILMFAGEELAAVIAAFRQPEVPQLCTRKPPHVCGVNGPCNGLPRPE